MDVININVSKPYDVIIGNGLLEDAGIYAKKVLYGGKIAVVADDITDSLYSEKVCESLEKSGFSVIKFVFEHGEKSKNADTYIKLLNFLAENEITRSDALLALGGGVVGDLTGFAAATFLRGINFIQCPTTLLAMVDSSVGGKTAIDLEKGKNLAGAFYQPKLVICDCDALKTLPDEIFSDGCAEVIKYGVLFDKELFYHLKEHGKSFDRQYVISKCVDLKRMTVVEDEFDKGARQLLNFGHTLGHSIEALSDFKISHGKAVAIGMSLITNASVKDKKTDKSVLSEIKIVLEKLGLPTSTKYSNVEIFSVVKNDKKRSGEYITAVIPEKIGKCKLEKMKLCDFEKLTKLSVSE